MKQVGWLASIVGEPGEGVPPCPAVGFDETIVVGTESRSATMAENSAVTAPDGEAYASELDPALDELERTLQDDGPAAAIDRLAARLDAQKNYRALLDALLLRARFDLGLPLMHVGALAEIAEPARSAYENRYVDAIRTVGSKFLASNDVAAAWPYYRAIGEFEPVARAIDDYRPADGLDEDLGRIIEVAINQGANPRRGWELILDHYGVCSAITALEQINPQDQVARSACVGRLVQHMHRQLSATLRAEVAARGAVEPSADASIESLCADHPWLFENESYHIDVSHLTAAVRAAGGLEDPATIALAADLCAYGRRLSDRLQYEGDPPFERTFDDHAAYFGAVLGREVDAAVDRFRAKIEASQEYESHSAIPAQVLVNLLVRTGRLDEAVETAIEHLAELPESSLICPGIAQLCQRLGRPRRLAEVARKQVDLVNFTAALLESNSSGASRPA